MSTEILRLENIKVNFQVSLDKQGFFAKKAIVKAVDDVSVSINQGQILGIVGESGCGKSTLARSIVQLVTPNAGQIFFEGKNIKNINKSYLRQNIQMIFQSPLGSLNPRLTVFDIVAEPLHIHYPKMSKKEVQKRVNDVLEEVGLNQQFCAGYPHEFSGGQCQRIGIARSLILNPKILICDEPISALDVSIQAQIINLLMTLRAKKNLTMIFIAHDLAVVKHISDQILVLYLGRSMELATKRMLFEDPQHPYTKALLASVPIPNPKVAKQISSDLISGDIPSPINPPSGCVFRTRCPITENICQQHVPKLQYINEDTSCACLATEKKYLQQFKRL